jgi:hypothetical protein
MRISQVPTLAVCLSIGGLAVWAAFGSMHDVAMAAPLDPVTASQCQDLPVPTPSASASASATDSPTAAASSPTPADLCISVQASQDSFQAGQNATWTVDVWAPNGPAYGVTVTLTGTLAGQTPTFTDQCPSGDGNDNCTIASVDSDIADSMQAQIAIPSGTAAGTSVTLTATADAVPSLPTTPTADTTVTTTAAPSPSSSPTPTKSATPSPSKGSTATTAASATATPGATLTPGIGTLPNYTGEVTPATGVSAVTDPGSITSLLPEISPGASAPSPTAGFDTSPAADDPAGAGAATDRASDSSYVLVVPVATAEKIGGVVLLLLAGLIIRLRLRPKKVAATAGGVSGGTPSGNAPSAAASPPSGDAPAAAASPPSGDAPAGEAPTEDAPAATASPVPS